MEVEGFEDFMVVVANSLLRDDKLGMVLRVGVGAVLSTIDALTDFYVISSYYKSEELVSQANALVVTIATNLAIQITFATAQYQKKSFSVKTKEALICIFFLRPVVDAYRVSTSDKDDELAVSRLSELIANRGIELATESIPGCVIQIYV